MDFRMQSPYLGTEKSSATSTTLATPVDTPLLDDKPAFLSITDFLPKEESISTVSSKATCATQLYKFFNKRDNIADAPPDGGVTAWLQVLAGFLITVNGWGMASSFGVYQAYYEADMLAGHSASSISWIGTLQACLTLLIGVLSGPLFDRGYFFHVLAVGSVGMVLSYVFLSLATNYWQILLCQGLLAGISSGLLYIPSISIIPMYFVSKRGTAIGLVTAGAPFGGIIYPILFKNLLESHGYATATRVVAAIIFVLLSITIALVKPLVIANRPRKLRDPTMFKDPYYISFLLAGFLTFMTLLTPYILSAEFFYTQITPDIDSAFYTVAIINAANFIGRVSLGVMSDNGLGGPEQLVLLCQATLAALAFAWIAVKASTAYYAWLVLWGYFSGGLAVLPASSMVYLCPSLDVYATRLGALYALAGVGVLIGTPIATAVNGSRSDYLGTQLWMGAVCVAGLAMSAPSSFHVTPLRRAATALRREQARRARVEGLGSEGEA